jgi:hypothetical protein
MNEDLIAELWARALVEGEGVRGVGQRMAQLVAEECVRVIEENPKHGGFMLADAIREKFGLSEI